MIRDQGDKSYILTLSPKLRSKQTSGKYSTATVIAEERLTGTG
jgi:hypothetical protein